MKKLICKMTRVLCSAALVSVLGFSCLGLAQDGTNYAGFTYGQELEIRNEILRQVEREGGVLDDPILNTYLAQLGERLTGREASNPDFRYFWLDNYNINAMAMPGKVIGINTGLLMATDIESELAGVLAHEIGHVKQRHIARRYEYQSQTATARTAVMIAAGALAALNADVGQAALMGAMGNQAQSQINQTRAYEQEADTAATQILRAAGIDTQGFSRFFFKLNSRGMGVSQAPAMLRSHPMPLDRAAAASQAAFDGQESSQEYELVKIRAAGLTNTRCHEQIQLQGYRYELSANYAQHWLNRCMAQSSAISANLAQTHWVLAAEHAEMLLEQGASDALKSFVEQSLQVWPSNAALTYYYVRGARVFGWPLAILQPEVIRDLDAGRFNQPIIYRDYALLAEQSGEVARANAARGYQAMHTGQMRDAMAWFRDAMQDANTVGATKNYWIQTIGELNQTYGL